MCTRASAVEMYTTSPFRAADRNMLQQRIVLSSTMHILMYENIIILSMRERRNEFLLDMSSRL